MEPNIFTKKSKAGSSEGGVESDTEEEPGVDDKKRELAECEKKLLKELGEEKFKMMLDNRDRFFKKYRSREKKVICCIWMIRAVITLEQSVRVSMLRLRRT